MQWIIFGIIAMIVISGVRRMAREGLGEVKGDQPNVSQAQQQKTKAVIDVQDTVQCSVCGAYMVKNAGACDRENCPFGKK